MRIFRAAEQIDGGRTVSASPDEITDASIAADMPNEIFRFFKHLNSWGFTYPEDAGVPGTDDEFDEALDDFYQGNPGARADAEDYIKSRWNLLKRFEPRYAKRKIAWGAGWNDMSDYSIYFTNDTGTDDASIRVFYENGGFIPEVMFNGGNTLEGDLFYSLEDAKRQALDLYFNEAERMYGKKAKVRTASTKTSAWSWDDQLNGYVASADAQDASFQCECGKRVAAPGMTSCECGKIWNSYTIASTDKNMLVCREVPRRDVLLARRESK